MLLASSDAKPELHDSSGGVQFKQDFPVLSASFCILRRYKQEEETCLHLIQHLQLSKTKHNRATTDKEKAADARANPNFLYRVDVSGGTHDAKPKKRGPRQGSSRHLEPLNSDLNQLSL